MIFTFCSLYICVFSKISTVNMHNTFFFKKLLFINYLLLTVLGLRCDVGFSLIGASRGRSLVAVHGVLFVVASPVAEHEL